MDNYGYAQTAAANKAWAPTPAKMGNVVQHSKDAERVLALDSLTQSIADANAELRECITTLADMADSVFGPTPPSIDAAGASPYSGRIGGLSSATDATHDLIRALRSQIERFRNL